MAFERFDRSLAVPADPDQVWSQVVDVRGLASCIEVLSEIEEVSPLSEYSAVLQDRLGPFKLRADLEVLVNVIEDGWKISGRASGQDRQIASYIRAEATIALSQEGSGTLIQIEGNYEVTGKTATLGSSSIRKKANEILDQFFENLRQRCS